MYEGAVDQFRALLQAPTVSRFEGERHNDAAFARFPQLLAELYPRVHVTLMAHWDVVPVDEPGWAHPPFKAVQPRHDVSPELRRRRGGRRRRGECRCRPAGVARGAPRARARRGRRRRHWAVFPSIEAEVERLRRDIDDDKVSVEVVYASGAPPVCPATGPPGTPSPPPSRCRTGNSAACTRSTRACRWITWLTGIRFYRALLDRL